MSRASDEFEHVSLSDRLNRRVVKIAERLGTSPKASVPKACGGWAETKAAYHFFDHDGVTSQQVLEQHMKKNACADEAGIGGVVFERYDGG